MSSLAAAASQAPLTSAITTSPEALSCSTRARNSAQSLSGARMPGCRRKSLPVSRARVFRSLSKPVAGRARPNYGADIVVAATLGDRAAVTRRIRREDDPGVILVAAQLAEIVAQRHIGNTLPYARVYRNQFIQRRFHRGRRIRECFPGLAENFFATAEPHQAAQHFAQ